MKIYTQGEIMIFKQRGWLPSYWFGKRQGQNKGFTFVWVWHGRPSVVVFRDFKVKPDSLVYCVLLFLIVHFYFPCWDEMRFRSKYFLFLRKSKIMNNILMEQNKFCFCKIMLVVTVIKYTICLQSSAQDLKIGAKLKHKKEFIFVKKKNGFDWQ